ncbi:MAG: ribosome biogenesis GTPase Der [Gammaproteobacteria bacterium]|nr:ribosome biogenesis GTPase Der [Gammaproteobacteria bacterium]
MYPTVALVGRPNVGKSTLFNKLTRSRDALVADVPGLTRDRRYGSCELLDHAITLIDTGGLFGEHILAKALTQQTQLAVAEADIVVLLLDGREGITTADHDVVTYLRRENVSFIPVINKIDGVNADQINAEFARFGFDDPLLISASHSRGIHALEEALIAALEAQGLLREQTPFEELPGVRVAVIGRPNVGKSTLVNRLIGEERQVVFDMPGTTKDAIDIPFERDGVDYVMIDTAGVRRKGKVDEVTEKFSVVKALQAMQRAHVVILVIDANEGVVEQDLHVLQYALDAGAAMVVAINKWDGLSEDQRDRVKKTVDRRLAFVPWVPTYRISALHGTGVGHLFGIVNEVYAAGEFDVSTSMLTRLVRNLVEVHPAPSIRGRQIKVKVATRAGKHPPRIVVHGNQLESLPASYRRYLENGFREALNLVGNPVKIELRDAQNPFAGKKNKLTQRQKTRRGRAIKHRKSK